MILEYRLKSNKNSKQMVNKCKAQHVNHLRLHASHRRLATGLSATFAGCVMRTVSLDLAGIETPAFGAPNCSTRVQSAEWTSTISSTLTINWRICCWINKPRVSVLHIPAGLSFCEDIIDWRRWLIDCSRWKSARSLSCSSSQRAHLGQRTEPGSRSS